MRFVTASELMEFYADPTPSRSFSRAEILSLARSVRKEISFQQLDRMSLSGADIFSLLTEAFSFYLERKEMPSATKLRQLYGPTLPFTPSSGRERPATFTWPAFTEAVRDVASYCRRSGHIPSEVWLGADSISPQDYLATLAALVDESVAWERLPDQVTVREGRLTAETYIAKDSLRLWDWVIFPKGFRAPKIMELAKLQAWTLKPALLQH